MPMKPQTFRPHSQTRKQVEQSWASRRDGRHAMYNLWIWRKPGGIREQALRANPLCVDCLKENRIVPATEAEHIEPHDGDMAKFVDLDNLTGRCKSCHSRKTMMEQRGHTVR